MLFTCHTLYIHYYYYHHNGASLASLFLLHEPAHTHALSHGQILPALGAPQYHILCLVHPPLRHTGCVLQQRLQFACGPFWIVTGQHEEGRSARQEGRQQRRQFWQIFVQFPFSTFALALGTSSEGWRIQYHALIASSAAYLEGNNK